jgi:hypothetical protein
MFGERLRYTFLKHVHEIENNSPFTAEMDVKIPQADVKIDHARFVAFFC